MCVAIAATKIAVVASAPLTVGSGTSAPRTRTGAGTRKGRSAAAFEKRSFRTASCAALNATSTPKLNRLARNPTGFVVHAVAGRKAIGSVAAATTVPGGGGLGGVGRAEA